MNLEVITADIPPYQKTLQDFILNYLLLAHLEKNISNKSDKKFRIFMRRSHRHLEENRGRN